MAMAMAFPSTKRPPRIENESLGQHLSLRGSRGFVPKSSQVVSESKVTGGGLVHAEARPNPGHLLQEARVCMHMNMHTYTIRM